MVLLLKGKSIYDKLIMLKTALEIENSRKKTPTASIFLPACGKTDSTLLVVLFLFSKAMQRRFSFLKQGKPQPSQQKRRGLNISRAAYMAYLCLCLSVFLFLPVPAVTIWDKPSEIMQDVYTQILTISTIAAIVTASVALLMMNFSRSNRTVEESRAWLKRIIITWVVLNGLGFIMAYITPFFSGGQWTP